MPPLITAKPTGYNPQAWWQGDQVYSRGGGWGTQRYVTHIPTLYDWAKWYWTKYAPDAQVAPTGQAAQFLERAKSDPQQFTSDVTSYIRGLGDVPNARDLSDFEDVDTALFSDWKPIGIEQEALMRALALYLHNSEDAVAGRQQPFTQVGMTNEQVAEVVQQLLSNPNAPPPTQWDMFRQAFDETAVWTMDAWHTGVLPTASDEQIQYALNPAAFGEPPLPPGQTMMDDEGGVEGGGTGFKGFTFDGQGHVGNMNPMLRQFTPEQLAQLRPEDRAWLEQFNPGGQGIQGMQGFADGAGATGNALFMQQMQQWQQGLDALIDATAGNPAGQAAAIQQYLAINPAPNPALASQLAADVSTAALGASGGLSTGGDGINTALGSHYTGQNYIQSSDGVLSPYGRVNPDMATHLQALARMQAAEGVFDPDVAAYLAQLRGIDNPYALFHSWTNPLPETDERWLGQYYLNYDPSMNKGAGFETDVRDLRVPTVKDTDLKGDTGGEEDPFRPDPPVRRGPTRRHTKSVMQSRSQIPSTTIKHSGGLPIHSSTDAAGGGGGAPIIRAEHLRKDPVPVKKPVVSGLVAKQALRALNADNEYL